MNLYLQLLNEDKGAVGYPRLAEESQIVNHEIFLTAYFPVVGRRIRFVRVLANNVAICDNEIEGNKHLDATGIITVNQRLTLSGHSWQPLN